MIRVAAVQFAVTNNVNDNLATCLRMINDAIKCKPNLIVLPEFVNHNSWYDDQDHCYQVSVDLNGEFLTAISQAAISANAYLVVNCTVRRNDNRVTGTSLMYSPSGELLAENNKQVLVGHENDFLDIATEQGPIVKTEIGKLAMYSCMDGVINETPRGLALRGAQVLCNSLNSFATDEGDLHIPVRAAENKAFIVAANKVGPLIPEQILEPISQAINIPMHFLCGAGDSQIVAPDGTVLAMAGKEEEVIWADIEVDQANNKQRPDGTDIVKSRRPELYKTLGEDPSQQTLPTFSENFDIPVAAISIDNTLGFELAINSACKQITSQHNSKLICLPELFWLANVDNAIEEISQSEKAVDAIKNVCYEHQYIATSIVKLVNGKPAHVAVLINQSGIIFEQCQVHFSQRFSWSQRVDSFAVYQSTVGCISLTLEDDSIYPETFRLIAMQGAEVVMVPTRQQESWQSTTGFWERASENRINLIAADANSVNNVICPLQKEFTIMTEWKEREFDGLLSASELIHGEQSTNITRAIIQPGAAKNKVCSHRTHLINNRPWQLLQALL